MATPLSFFWHHDAAVGCLRPVLSEIADIAWRYFPSISRLPFHRFG